MQVGEGPILPAALARHSSSSCIQSSGVLPKLKFQPSYNEYDNTTYLHGDGSYDVSLQIVPAVIQAPFAGYGMAIPPDSAATGGQVLAGRDTVHLRQLNGVVLRLCHNKAAVEWYVNVTEEAVHRTDIFKEQQPHCQMDVGHSRQLKRQEVEVTESSELARG